jgi:hypothetical protein
VLKCQKWKRSFYLHYLVSVLPVRRIVLLMGFIPSFLALCVSSFLFCFVLVLATKQKFIAFSSCFALCVVLLRIVFLI